MKIEDSDKRRIKNILITGDDGYNSIGTKLLVHFLKDQYKLTIAGTKKQQSGVGGKLTFDQKVQWGETTVNGVKTVWVDGTPCDAVEFTWNYFKEIFDLVISGINLGANVTGAIMSSGTYAAAFRALNLPIAKKGLALSWNCPPERWYEDGDLKMDLKSYLEYPGQAVKQIIDLVLENDFWGFELLNINLPLSKSNEVKFTKPLPSVTDFYSCSVNINHKEHYYIHPSAVTSKSKERSVEFDGNAIRKGYISITPCQTTFSKEDVYLKLKDLTIEL